MGKIDAYDVKGVPQEQIDFNDDVRTLLNFGKVQKTIITTGAAPTWPGRGGEEVYTFSAASATMFVCTTDDTTNWVPAYTFNL